MKNKGMYDVQYIQWNKINTHSFIGRKKEKKEKIDGKRRNMIDLLSLLRLLLFLLLLLLLPLLPLWSPNRISNAHGVKQFLWCTQIYIYSIVEYITN